VIFSILFNSSSCSTCGTTVETVANAISYLILIGPIISRLFMFAETPVQEHEG